MAIATDGFRTFYVVPGGAYEILANHDEVREIIRAGKSPLVLNGAVGEQVFGDLIEDRAFVDSLVTEA